MAMRFVPTPVPVRFKLVYSATANPSGRMQYHKIKPGDSKLRISRAEFIRAYNELPIIAIKPLQQPGQETIFEFEFYV
ncbi:MAG TPA: hypothetical protein VIH22_13920 [Cyclobacteriaceae bacterium]